MRALRLSLVGAVTLALLSGLGGTAFSQSDDFSRSGVWATQVDEQDCWNGAPTDYIEQASGDYQVRGIPVGCDLTFSDPRLSGAWTWAFNEDCFADGGCVNWATMEAVGPDGSWTGWGAGSEDPDTATHVYIVLTGTGAYEGLTHVQHWSGPFAGPFERHGVTYQGVPHPVVDVGVLGT